MSLHTILVVNNAPGCNTQIEQQITVTGCTTYIVRLASNSNALGPFSIYVDNVLYGSGYSRTDMFNGVVVNLECATPTPTPSPSNTNGPTPTPTQTPTATSLIPNQIIVNGYYFSGSIGAGYSAVANYVTDVAVNVNFQSILQTTTGSPVTQNVTVTIGVGEISGFTQTFIQGLYVDLTQQASLTGFTATPDGGTIYNFSANTGTTVFDVTPTPTPSITPSPTQTPSVTPTQTTTPTNTQTSTPTPTVTQTPTQSATPGLTPTQTSTVTPSETPTNTPTTTQTQTTTPTPSVTPSQTPTNTPTTTQTPSQTASQTPTPTPTLSPGATPYATSTPTPTTTPTLTPTNTASQTPTQTPTPTTTPTTTPSETPTLTPTQTPSQTPTNTPTTSQTPTNTATPSETPTQTPTPTPTLSPGATPNETSTPTPTPSITPSESPTQTPSVTPSVTPTLTPSNTASQTPTQTPTQTETPTQTPTNTPSLTPTQTPSQTASETPTPTPSFTPTATNVPLLSAYLFIEPTSIISNMAGWMNSQSTPGVFRGFSAGAVLSTNPTTFNTQMNNYIQYSGWGGNAPAIGTGITSNVSGGNDAYGNPITAYLFQTYKVPAGTAVGNAWYTWIIPTGSTNGQKVTQIGFNNAGNPNSLTVANMSSSIYNLTVTTTGSTLPVGVYRVYTTYTNSTMRMDGTLNDIYFKGNTLG
jgi:hypothetical protein